MTDTVMWINHLDLSSSDPTMKLSHSSGASFVNDGLIVEATSPGDLKWVNKIVAVPPGYLVTGVRLGYQLSNARSYVSQIRLAQLQDPPHAWLVILDDPTDRKDLGPSFAESQSTAVDPRKGSVNLELRLNFGNTADKIVILGLGLHLRSTP